MSFVIRLKHLPDEADSGDIRRFFKKVQIPEGGVRILGGEKGIVYITLATETGFSVKYNYTISKKDSDLKKALEYCSEFSGDMITEDVLDGIFSRFCVGK